MYKRQEFLPREDILSYCEAILRVYNLHGRRDNKYKARIKILVNALGIDEFRTQVEEEWAHFKDQELKLHEVDFDTMQAFFPLQDYEVLDDGDARLEKWRSLDTRFNAWYEHNTLRTNKLDTASSTSLLKSMVWRLVMRPINKWMPWPTSQISTLLVKFARRMSKTWY